ncbi:MAG: DinB family protein [Acidobacteria bacterium]|nr:DinB family protein [Acidobacteriota bacterium]
MARPATTAHSDSDAVLLEIFAVNERINQLLLECLDQKIWRAKPPDKRSRTIAVIIAHIHNIRRKWIRLSAPQMVLPTPLNPKGCTMKQAARALAGSARGCLEMLGVLLNSSSGLKFRRDGWAKPWPAGAATVAYMISHEAHHRGQICMLAHQLGSPLPRSVGGQIWNWEKIWKQCGYTQPR